MSSVACLGGGGGGGSSEQRTRVVEYSLGYVTFFGPATESYTSLTKEQNRLIHTHTHTESLKLCTYPGLHGLEIL